MSVISSSKAHFSIFLHLKIVFINLYFVSRVKLDQVIKHKILNMIINIDIFLVTK